MFVLVPLGIFSCSVLCFHFSASYSLSIRSGIGLQLKLFLLALLFSFFFVCVSTLDLRSILLDFLILFPGWAISYTARRVCVHKYINRFIKSETWNVETPKSLNLYHLYLLFILSGSYSLWPSWSFWWGGGKNVRAALQLITIELRSRIE